MRRSAKLLPMLVVAALTLAACDDSDEDDDDASNGGPQNQFGSAFASAFDAPSTADPIDPEAGDAGEPSLTDDPVEF